MADNITETLNSIQSAFEEFKSTNDANLGKRDVVLEEKLNKINDALDTLGATQRELEKKAQRPTIESSDIEAAKEEFKSFLRSGIDTKAMSGSVTTEGGYTVPKLIDKTLNSALVDISPIRSIAKVLTVDSPDFHLTFNTGGTASSWVSDKASRPETTAPTLADVTPSFGEVYSNVFVTQQLLDDSMFDIEQFVVATVATEQDRAEGAAFISGDGTNKPKGILGGPTPVTTADATRTFGTLQYIASGNAGALPTGFDKYDDVITSIKAGYRKNANWLTNKAVIGEWRKVKDSTGQYLWQPSNQAGIPDKFRGYGVVEAEDVPAIGSNSFSVIFGDFSAGYVIADRIGTRFLRNPYSNMPYVTFYVSRRVGGGLYDTAALKLLKCSAS